MICVTGPAIVTKAEPVVFGVVVWSPLPETVTPEAAVAVGSGDTVITFCTPYVPLLSTHSMSARVNRTSSTARRTSMVTVCSPLTVTAVEVRVRFPGPVLVTSTGGAGDGRGGSRHGELRGCWAGGGRHGASLRTEHPPVDAVGSPGTAGPREISAENILGSALTWTFSPAAGGASKEPVTVSSRSPAPVREFIRSSAIRRQGARGPRGHNAVSSGG